MDLSHASTFHSIEGYGITNPISTEDRIFGENLKYAAQTP